MAKGKPSRRQAGQLIPRPEPLPSLPHTYLDGAIDAPASDIAEAITRCLNVVRTLEAVSAGKVHGITLQQAEWLMDVSARRFNDVGRLYDSVQSNAIADWCDRRHTDLIQIGPITAGSYFELAAVVCLGYAEAIGGVTDWPEHWPAIRERLDIRSACESVALLTMNCGLVVKRNGTPRSAETLDLIGARIRALPRLDLETIARGLRKEMVMLAAAARRPASLPTNQSHEQPPHDKVLRGWRQILRALGAQASEKQNIRYQAKAVAGCPIVFGSKGKRPEVSLSDLLQWWDVVFRNIQGAADSDRNKALTVSETYDHRGATVVPGIAGHIRRRSNKVD